MIEPIPAIDIIDGKCVRLTRGDYSTKTIYGDPSSLARKFERHGFRRLHLVDLDGARIGRVVNIDILWDIAAKTDLMIDFGGGVKTDKDIEKVFACGAAMATVGSVALTNPDLYNSWLSKYGAEHLILGADVRDGMVSINGWQNDSKTTLQDFLAMHMKAGTRNVLCTDISRDGTLQGPSTGLYAQVMKAYPQCNLIASGGVRSMEDIDALDRAGVPAVVIGKAIYEGTIDTKELGERCWQKG